MGDESVIDGIIPEIEGNIGTAQVSYAEVGSVLSQADTALDMVRSSSFGNNLSNIAYIYNTSEAGAFGVFDPSLDRSVKVKLVEERMRSMGYNTEYRGGSLYAWSEGRDPSEIKSQMEELYESLEIKGGLVIGINSSRIMAVAKKNYDDLSTVVSNSIANGEDILPLDQSDLDQLVALHLGSTIVHESVHALGDKGESGPISAQNAWTQEIIPQLNAQRQAANKVPLEISGETYTAAFDGMSKSAQTAGLTEYVLPEVLLNIARGEDPGMGVVRNPNESMETILSNNCHNPVDADFCTETELGKDRLDEESAGMIIEDLLDENRPHPVIRPIRRQAGINSNSGGPFISSPFSVDELLPRVMDGRDIVDKIDYKEGEEPFWHQRYKPENIRWTRDSFGRASYQYDERLKVVDYDNNSPQSWDMLFREDIVTGPWRRMGSQNVDKRNDMLSLIRRVGFYKNSVNSGKRRAVRFICDRQIADRIMRAVSDSRMISFHHGDFDALWVYNKSATEQDIIDIERAISEDRDHDMVNEFMATADDIKDRINTIISRASDICSEHGIKDVYIVGGFPRVLAGDKDFLEVNDLDFTSGRPTECLKLGGLVAEEFNSEASIYHRTMTMSFTSLGVKMDFRGNFVAADVRSLMREADIPVTPLNYDIYARDFTVNSLIYDFVENKIYDITGRSIDDLKNKILRTHFDPMDVIPGNPLIITRAIILNMRGYRIHDELYEAMKKLSGTLFTSDVSEIRLAYEYDKIAGYEDADFMLKEFGLEKLKEINETAKRNNPELFED